MLSIYPLRRPCGALALLFMALLPAAGVHAEATGGAVTVDAKFPGGNIQVEKNEGATVQLAPDLRGDSPWFYWHFAATAVQSGRVRFEFPEQVIGMKNGGIGPQGPAISTDGGQSWRWMGTQNVDGKAFFYDFRAKEEQVRFAVTIPYVQANLDAFLQKHAGNSHLKTSVLTKSRHGRPVELLRIGQPGPGVLPVLTTCRHHAVETMASFVLEGFLAAAMSETPTGETFRKQYVLWSVPQVDKDGVEEGDQGKNRKPHDHNRDYGEKSIYPEIQAIRELDKTHDFKLTLDFHCPTLVLPDHQVMYFDGPKDHPANNFVNVTELARWIKQGLPAGAPSGPHVWLKVLKEFKPANSYYFGHKPGMIMATCLEFPFAPPGKNTDPESCRRYGEAVLAAWVNTHFVPQPQ